MPIFFKGLLIFLKNHLTLIKKYVNYLVLIKIVQKCHKNIQKLGLNLDFVSEIYILLIRMENKNRKSIIESGELRPVTLNFAAISLKKRWNIALYFIKCACQIITTGQTEIRVKQKN